MLDELDNVFDDHPSLDASLEDFENNSNAHRSPVFGLPSQHSGFRSEESDGEEDDATPNGDRWSPPGLRQYEHAQQNNGWYRRQPYMRKVDHDRLLLKPTVGLSPSLSREPSPQYEDAVESPTVGNRSDVSDLRDITIAANVPLPAGGDTPQKGRSPSPGPAARTNPDDAGLEFGPEGNNISNCRLLTLKSSPFPLPQFDRRLIWTGSPSRHPVRRTCRSSASRTLGRHLYLSPVQVRSYD